MIRNGYDGKINEEGKEGKIWYIPHHGIFHQNKPRKVQSNYFFDCPVRHKDLVPTIIFFLAGYHQQFAWRFLSVSKREGCNSW